MTISLVGPTKNQVFLLEEESLIKIQNGSWNLYHVLANEDLKVEFIKEAIYIQSPASLIHEEIFRYLLVKISLYLEKKQLGKVLGSRFPIILSDGGRAEPDLLFLSNQTIKDGKLTNTYFEGKPTWIIEIISPSYRDYDTITKRAEYAKLDVEEYWIIDPELKIVEIVNFKNGKEIRKEIKESDTISPRLAGFEEFSVNIESLFAKGKN